MGYTCLPLIALLFCVLAHVPVRGAMYTWYVRWAKYPIQNSQRGCLAGFSIIDIWSHPRLANDERDGVRILPQNHDSVEEQMEQWEPRTKSFPQHKRREEICLIACSIFFFFLLSPPNTPEHTYLLWIIDPGTKMSSHSPLWIHDSVSTMHQPSKRHLVGKLFYFSQGCWQRESRVVCACVWHFKVIPRFFFRSGTLAAMT